LGGWRFGNAIDGAQAEYLPAPDAMGAEIIKIEPLRAVGVKWFLLEAREHDDTGASRMSFAPTRRGGASVSCLNRRSFNWRHRRET
jgi:hypothetical protein